MLKREQIKDRMMKTAARLWEIPEGDIETNFDPLIILLLEACAAELESVGAHINASQDRLLDKLAELILPEAMINAQPASCVMQATPVEASSTLSNTVRFYTTQRLQQIGSAAYNQDFYFTPVGNFKILKASLSYLKAGSKFYRLLANGQKELIHDEGTGHLANEICLAISADKMLSSLKGFSYFLT